MLSGESVDLSAGGPDVAEKHRVAVGIVTERLRLKVKVHRTGKGVCNHKRRRGEVISAHMRVNAALKVTVARQDTYKKDR